MIRCFGDYEQEGAVMEEGCKDNASKVEVVGWAGPIWLMGWLFTLGFLHPPFFKAVLAILLWPYYLGAALG
jgi:hypothetical protein